MQVHEPPFAASRLAIDAIGARRLGQGVAFSRRVVFWVAALVAAALLSAAAFAAPSAQAYSHAWNCNSGIGANAPCYDYSGQTYNPWTTVAGGFGSPFPSGYNGMCVKARTAAGNTKSGSNCYPASVIAASISVAAQPQSQGYYYFGGSGTSINNAGNAST